MYNITKTSTSHLRKISNAFKEFIVVKGCLEILSAEAQQEIQVNYVIILRELERRKQDVKDEEA